MPQQTRDLPCKCLTRKGVFALIRGFPNAWIVAPDQGASEPIAPAVCVGALALERRHRQASRQDRRGAYNHGTMPARPLLHRARDDTAF
jgi:hypothetical protein